MLVRPVRMVARTNSECGSSLQILINAMLRMKLLRNAVLRMKLCDATKTYLAERRRQNQPEYKPVRMLKSIPVKMVSWMTASTMSGLRSQGEIEPPRRPCPAP